MPKKQYIVYDNEDMPVCIGSGKKCADFIGIKMNSFYVAISKNKKGLMQGKFFKIYAIEKEEEMKEKVKTKYKEIFRLKEMLEKEDIPFEFIDTSFECFESYQIAYPCLKSCKCSIIQGYGTYGAKYDLLDIDGLLTESERKIDTVVGHLTAENVLARIKKDMKKEREKKANEI